MTVGYELGAKLGVWVQIKIFFSREWRSFIFSVCAVDMPLLEDKSATDRPDTSIIQLTFFSYKRMSMMC